MTPYEANNEGRCGHCQRMPLYSNDDVFCEDCRWYVSELPEVIMCTECGMGEEEALIMAGSDIMALEFLWNELAAPGSRPAPYPEEKFVAGVCGQCARERVLA